MINKDQHLKVFWLALAILFILSFLTAYSLADDPAIKFTPSSEIEKLSISEKVKIFKDIDDLARIIDRIQRKSILKPGQIDPVLTDQFNNYLNSLGYSDDDLWHLKSVYEGYNEGKKTPPRSLVQKENKPPKFYVEDKIQVDIDDGPDRTWKLAIVEKFYKDEETNQWIYSVRLPSVENSDETVLAVTDDRIRSIEPITQNIKAEVEEIKPEFKFKKGTVVLPNYRHFFWADTETTTRITDRAVLWGENVYRVERNRRRQPGDNGSGIWYETISEKDLQFPEKKQPEYVEGLQP